MVQHLLLCILYSLLLFRQVVIYLTHALISPMAQMKVWALALIAKRHRRRHVARLQQTIANTEDYHTWLLTARRLDWLNGFDKWSTDNQCVLYNATEVQQQLEVLRQLRAQNNPQSLAFTLRFVLHRNLFGMGHKGLFPFYCGTKRLLEEYVHQVVDDLELLLEASELTLSEKFSFFQDALQSFGHTALILSAGTALGVHHLGVVKALWDAQMLPTIICGTEVGAIVAAFVCSCTRQEIGGLFAFEGVDLSAFESKQSETIRSQLGRFLKEGSLIDLSSVDKFLHDNLGDCTFQDCFNRSEKVLNITIWTSAGPQTLNYLVAPNVLVRSAAFASMHRNNALPLNLASMTQNGPSSCCFEFRPCQGYVLADTPLAPLRQWFDTNFYIVSQTNAHIVPFEVLDNPSSVCLQRGLAVSVVTACISFLVKEVRHWLSFVRRSCLTRRAVLHHLHQGDITIIPACAPDDYIRIFQPPTLEHFEQCVVNGCRRAWPQMTNVRYHCAIEQKLKECLSVCRSALKISICGNVFDQ
eukprot:NODE_1085_length_1667_cov_44.134416_g1018_i0.p1 GENE.NODE_1085_length_1667_cov_44.134416_g1018_i0~~NODE_1085_length_1667_cov_44.134416_g1018_i0.p1  ORF type:complete len:545 (+),score=136.73 NODE_1085_length_1667_cov_44.134416_g1018_i0:55-1635(+)